jgi:hypothetical protein
VLYLNAKMLLNIERSQIASTLRAYRLGGSHFWL